MGFRIVTEQTADFLHVSLSGSSATEDDFLNSGRRVASLCGARGCSRVLIDERATDSTVTPHGRMRIIDELWRELNESRVQRIACVSTARIASLASVEQLAQQRGIDYRFFKAPEEAAAWLTDDDEDPA